MSVVDARNFLHALTEQFQSQEDLSCLQNIRQTVKDLQEAQQRQRQQLESMLKQLQRKMDMVKACLDTVSQTVNDQSDQHHVETVRRLEREQVQLKHDIVQAEQRAVSLQQASVELQQVLRELQEMEGQPELDEMSLRLKIYKALGFDMQEDEKGSAKRNDVQTIMFDQRPQTSRYQLANEIWAMSTDE